MARFVLKLPLIEIDSVGAGTGSYVRLDPISKRIEFGPDSAGSRIGMCYVEGGVDTPTLSDCNIILGNLNPFNFLGGEVVLDKDRAYAAIKERIADPLGLDPYDAAEGVLNLFENHLRNEVYARVFGKGYSPEDYTLFSYGGGGPMHVAGYTRDSISRMCSSPRGRPDSRPLDAPARISNTGSTERSTFRRPIRISRLPASKPGCRCFQAPSMRAGNRCAHEWPPNSRSHKFRRTGSSIAIACAFNMWGS